MVVKKIDDMISFLKEAKSKGAVFWEYEHRPDRDWPMWFVNTYRNITPEEQKQERIAELKKQIDELKK